MTSRVRALSIIIGIVALIAGYFYTTIDWEARAVRQRLDELAALVEKDGPVSTFEGLARSRQLSEVLLEGADVEYAPGRNLPKDLDAVGAAFLAVWGRVEQASVRVLRHDVDIDDSRTQAESRITARCSVVYEGAEQMGDTLDYKIYWRKVEGDWRIRSLFPLN